MKYLLKIFFLSVLCLPASSRLLCGEAEAANRFSLKFVKNTETESNKLLLEQFLIEVEGTLPERFKSVINQQIEVALLPSTEPLLLPVCQSDSLQLVTQIGANNQILGMHLNGRHSKNKIFMSASFLPEIILGRKASRTYNCGHRSLYRLAQATLIHELGHLYDDEKRISQKTQFLSLMKFHHQKSLWNLSTTGGLIPQGYASRNFLNSRSPDPYEFRSPRESFSVNLEFFLLDPDFSCRKPVIANFFKEELSFEVPHSCQVNTLVPLYTPTLLGNETLIADLDPNRIYRIDYLFAGKTKALMSRWGHAMFRIILCDPTRAQVGPECLNDVEFHVVAGFKAHTNGLQIDPIKGLTGGYPSQLYLEPFLKVIESYNKGESRDVESIPLSLSALEKEKFTLGILEQFWSYQGKYNFIANNCGTEALNVVQTAAYQNIHTAELKAITPAKLRSTIISSNFSPAIPEKFEERERRGEFFRSDYHNLQLAFAAVPAYVQSFKSVDDFLSKSDALGRLAAYNDGIVLLGPVEKVRAAQNAFVLEAAFMRRTSTLFETRLMKTVFLNKTNQELKEIKDGIINSADEASENPWAQLTGGYGIPSAEEMGKNKFSHSREKEKREFLTHLEKWALQKFPNELSEIQQIKNNKNYFLGAFLDSP